MSTDQHFHIGRGGAGNFFSRKDLEEAEKKNLEAHKDDASSARPPAPASQQNPYVHAGRGGAGNFHDAAAVAAAEREESIEIARLQASTEHATAGPDSAGQPRTSGSTRPMVFGRGGAGNWAASNAAAAAAEAEEQRRKEAAMAAQIQQDVDAGLSMPRKTYHQAPVAREREK